MTSLSRLLQIAAVPLVGMAALFFFWSYAAYQDVPWLPVFFVTGIVTLASFGYVVVLAARTARLTVGAYKLKYLGRIVATLAVLGIFMPILSFVSVALTSEPTSGYDLSGIQFYQSGLALFVFFEGLAVAAKIAIPLKARR